MRSMPSFYDPHRLVVKTTSCRHGIKKYEATKFKKQTRVIVKVRANTFSIQAFLFLLGRKKNKSNKRRNIVAINEWKEKIKN